MNAFFRLTLILCILTGAGCAGSRQSFQPEKKFSPQALRQDYALLREILEKFHPSLYWYTSKDSMDAYFDHYAAAITDSMTEQGFGFQIIAPLLTAIRCGHTSFNFSKAYSRFLTNKRIPGFPLGLKVWKDTMVVTFNLNRKDSLLKRGTLISAINLWDNKRIIDTLFRYMPADGFSENVNYIRLSTAFSYYHRNVFGLSRNYLVQYQDSTGTTQNILLPVFEPPADSLFKKQGPRPPASPGFRPKDARRSFRIDTTNQMAIMTINTFSDGNGLKAFYRKSFKIIRHAKINNLVIDLRNNGGGDINQYTHLARYIRNTPFKVADTAAALRAHFGAYGKYIQYHFINSIALSLLTTKYDDGRYHFRYWEKHVYQPKKKNHYTGNVYVLISGPSFSATTLFCHTVKGQENVKLVGEEAGGGWHGNNGVMIPNITLPQTRLRVRLPLFRLVQFNHVPKDGRGVMPDIEVPPTLEGVRRGADLKLEKVRALVKLSDSSKQ